MQVLQRHCRRRSPGDVGRTAGGQAQGASSAVVGTARGRGRCCSACNKPLPRRRGAHSGRRRGQPAPPGAVGATECCLPQKAPGFMAGMTLIPGVAMAFLTTPRSPMPAEGPLGSRRLHVGLPPTFWPVATGTRTRPNGLRLPPLLTLTNWPPTGQVPLAARG